MKFRFLVACLLLATHAFGEGIPAPPPIPAHLYNAVQDAHRQYYRATTKEAKAYATILLTTQGVDWMNAQREMIERSRQKGELDNQAEALCSANGDYVFDKQLITCVPKPKIPGTPPQLLNRSAESK